MMASATESLQSYDDTVWLLDSDLFKQGSH